MQIDDTKKKKYIKYLPEYLANHYGFEYLDIEEKIFKNNLLVEDEKVKILKACKNQVVQKRRLPSKMFFYKKPILKKENNQMGIDIINVPSAIAEATVIKTAISILKEEGYDNIMVILNAIGDQESQKEFKTALTLYYRERRSELKNFEKKKITKDPLSIFYSDKEYLKEINQAAPSPMQFLSKNSIDHFQDTIEFLESFNVDYLIDEKMTGSKLFFSKIIFKITAIPPKGTEVEEVGYGGRYDEIIEEITKRKKVSAIGLSLNFKKQNKTQVKLTQKKINLHLLKIGSTAKLKYLEVLDALAKIAVPIKYNIKEEKISKQIKQAISDEAEYSIIIGEIEAKKDKVLVRKMKDFSQKEIPVKDLGKYIKKIIK